MAEAEESVIRISDPQASYLARKSEIDAAVARVLASSQHILGPEVESFEAKFAAYIGAAYGIGVNSGTDALSLALRSLEIGPGDEVITASHTSVATVAAICMAGATPQLVDVDPDWWTIDPDAVEAAVSPRTRAVIAVHLYGQPADMGALTDICSRNSLALIEDCAQAHGATWYGRRVGNIGTIGCFSFYPTKNLGAVGDAGMAVTNDPTLASRLRMLRQYGWDRPQHSVMRGVNSRLDPLQAAILSVKLS